MPRLSLFKPEKGNDFAFIDVHNEFKVDSFKYIKPIKEACQFIKICRKLNLKMALISSDSEKNTQEVASNLDLFDDFDLIIGGDSGYGDKSEGNSALHFCNFFSLLGSEVITIGDAPSDYKMAKNANLKGSILVETGQIKIDKLYLLSEFSVHTLKDLSIINKSLT